MSQSWMRSKSARTGALRGWVTPLVLALVGCGGASAYAPPPGGVTRAESYGGSYAEAESAPMAAPSTSADFAEDVVSGDLAQPSDAMIAQAAPAQNAAPVPQGAATSTPPRAEADDAQRGPLLIYQATLHLSVFEVEATQRSVIGIAQDLGGFLARQSDQQVVIRVPAGKFRDALARIEETGDVLHRNVEALDVSEDFVGGRLTIEGRYDDSQAAQGDPPLTGSALIDNFHLINAPGLAKLLSVASLTGILNILRGDGISFDRFEAPFTLKDDVLITKDVKMNGASLGFTAEGWVSFRDDTLALRGTVVPAYTINSVLGNIPLLGRLLTGGDGSGVFAATYRMTGKLDDPDVSVNPLATLTPGFLRGLFGIFESDMPAPGADPAEREAPPPKAPINAQN